MLLAVVAVTPFEGAVVVVVVAGVAVVVEVVVGEGDEPAPLQALAVPYGTAAAELGAAIMTAPETIEIV